ncbi:unnamed protein product [Vitrella brassicaformis CCMP3155]|uniref:Uncharacterized protein n=2 Tax=Vitrella brassicaformis TaxID=1169539 RepID=A0A0G4ETS5_VITBC|nr:unnamed protein product [Vitrella brassicaformis CCMP3155]|eukprot:CEM01659.1 unnamed protein product [Vitrella brassicaformis CCMP3155]
MMNIDRDDAPAASAGGPSGDDSGGSSSRDLLQQIHSVASQIASDAAERADHITATHTDSTTQDGASLSAIPGNPAAVRSASAKELTQITTDYDTLTLRAPRYEVGTRVSVAAEQQTGESVWVTAVVYDTQETNGGTVVFMREVEGREEELKPVTVPHRTKPPPQYNQDLRMGGKTFRWGKKSDQREGGAVVGTTTKPQKSAAVSACDEGESKRRRVALESAAAAAGGGSVDVCGPAEGTSRPMNTPKKPYGRPSLSGLPEEVFSPLGSFLSTIDNIRLSRVNRVTHEKATDKTFGVFRNFTMTRGEERIYDKIKTLQHLKHMGKIQTAFVDARVVPPVASKLLEANKDSLKKITLNVESWSRTPDAGPIVFSSLTDLDVRGLAGLDYLRRRRWIFPALTTLRVGTLHTDHTPHLVRLLETSPMIRRLEADSITFDNDDDQWAGFIPALAGCPHLTTLTGLQIKMDQFGRINQLKDTLSKHCNTQEPKCAPKRLGFVVVDAEIGVDYGLRVADMEGISEWVADGHCQLDWLPESGPMTIDCSTTAATAPPAPDGLYEEIATRLAANATHLRLKLGGTPLHESWRQKLIFTKAKKLEIKFTTKQGVSASGAVEDSIPEWLAERQGDGEGRRSTSRCFPAVKELLVFSFSLSLADVRAASSKLRPLVGGLGTLKGVRLYGVSSFAAACEFLSYLSVGQLDEVRISESGWRVVCEWPADAPASWGDRRPSIDRLTSSSLCSKAGVREFIKLALALRPVSVELEARLEESGLEGDSEADKLADLRSFADECARQTAPHYTVKKSECECGWYGFIFTLKLMFK